jgi:ubiquinol-cytochrome c reductase cytochrome c subunit
MTRVGHRRLNFAAMSLLATALVGGLISLSGIASAAERTTHPRAVARTLPPPFVYYNSFDAGMANSQIQVFNKAGQLVLYGDSDVLYRLPPATLIGLGQQLYESNCSQCHGVDANGVPAPGTPGGAFPDLLGLGPATYDFWIESGRMPAVATKDTQAARRPARLDQGQALAISAYINSLQPATPYIPQVNLKGASLSEGEQLFALNCAACHTITGDGDALANDTFAPSLRNIPAYQVAEALRIGPANMPVFTGNLTDAQLRDVVDYVVKRIQHPQNPGGLGLGGLGPVGEGFIGLALGVGLLALVGFWVGDRT